MLVVVPAGLAEPLGPVLLPSPLLAGFTSSLTSPVVTFFPFFVDLGFAGVFFFSEDTAIGCSSEWRERYHLQTPLCTPRSPITKPVERPKQFGLEQ